MAELGLDPRCPVSLYLSFCFTCHRWPLRGLGMGSSVWPSSLLLEPLALKPLTLTFLLSFIGCPKLLSRCRVVMQRPCLHQPCVLQGLGGVPLSSFQWDYCQPLQGRFHQLPWGTELRSHRVPKAFCWVCFTSQSTKHFHIHQQVDSSILFYRWGNLGVSPKATQWQKET